MEQTMISVIIPTYKSPEALELCLRSAIQGQQNKNQIIVVVDGYYELNRIVLNRYSKHIDILNLETNVGLCRGTNLGVYNARYDNILIVNDDNVFPGDWDVHLTAEWNEQSKRFDTDAGVVLAPNQIEPRSSMFKQFHIKDLGTDIFNFDLDAFHRYEQQLESKYTWDYSGSTLPIFMRKTDYIRIGGWDEHYELGMVADWDFFLKCQLSGLKMLRTYRTHFYHFASVSANGEVRQTAEQAGHQYAAYKWGSYIKHNPETNLKFL
tara:strand:- start:3534 stop:4328 length:795 start_codon:yes stop_codon:yes gene_type:complete